MTEGVINRTSGALTSVHKAIAAVQAEIGEVEKGRTASGGGRYQYRGIDDVVAAVHPLFAKHQLLIVPSVVGVEYMGMSGNFHQVRVDMTFMLVGPEGDSIERPFSMISQNNGGADKAIGSAISYATRYFLVTLLTIPAHGDDADPEARAENPPTIRPKPAKKAEGKLPTNKRDRVSRVDLLKAGNAAGVNAEQIVARANHLRPQRKGGKFTSVNVLATEDQALVHELIGLLERGDFDNPDAEPFGVLADQANILREELGEAARQYKEAGGRTDYTPADLVKEVEEKEGIKIDGGFEELVTHHPDLATAKLESLKVETMELIAVEAQYEH